MFCILLSIFAVFLGPLLVHNGSALIKLPGRPKSRCDRDRDKPSILTSIFTNGKSIAVLFVFLLVGCFAAFGGAAGATASVSIASIFGLFQQTFTLGVRQGDPPMITVGIRTVDPWGKSATTENGEEAVDLGSSGITSIDLNLNEQKDDGLTRLRGGDTSIDFHLNNKDHPMFGTRDMQLPRLGQPSEVIVMTASVRQDEGICSIPLSQRMEQDSYNTSKFNMREFKSACPYSYNSLLDLVSSFGRSRRFHCTTRPVLIPARE